MRKSTRAFSRRLPFIIALACAPALGQDTDPALVTEGERRADTGRAPRPNAAAGARDREATLSVASEPSNAVVYVVPLTDGETPRLTRERLVGRTPLETRVPSGQVEVVVAKDGYVLKVEPVELRAGAAARLEVRLARDVELPRGIALLGGPRLVKNAADGEALYNRVLAAVVQLYVDEKDPRALIDASVRTTIDALEAVRARETLLRRELSGEARRRFYRQEVDLRDYPALLYAERETESGTRAWSLSAGGASTDGITDPRSPETHWKKLRRVVTFLKESWDTRSQLDDSMLTRCLLEGLFGALDDGHSHFLPPDALRDFGSEAKGSFGGIGIVVALKDGKLTVIVAMEGTPGERAGLVAGDRILEIDGRNTEHMPLSEAVTLLRGEPDSRLELVVARGDAAPRKLEVVRASIKTRATKSSALSVNAGGVPVPVGYLRVTSFMPEDLEKEVEAAIAALEATGIRGLVLDLRNNPGGLLEKACQLADLFVEEGTIVTTRARAPGQSRAVLARKDVRKRRLPLVVLVNEGSASASEVLAGTLREHGAAVLVGDTTFGKGSVQRVIPLEPFDCAVALTIATYHLPSGATPHRKGLTPDVVVKLTPEEKARLASRSIYREEEGKDRQLEAALEALAKKLR